MRTLQTCASFIIAVAAWAVAADEAHRRARVSLSELNALGTVIRAYMLDSNKAPDTASVASLIPLLTPKYIIHLPLRDGWDTPIRYVRTGEQSFYVISAGADRTFDEKSWAVKTDLKDIAADAVYSVETVTKPGTFTRRWVDSTGKPLGVTTEEYMEANRAELDAAVARMKTDPHIALFGGRMMERRAQLTAQARTWLEEADARKAANDAAGALTAYMSAVNADPSTAELKLLPHYTDVMSDAAREPHIAALRQHLKLRPDETEATEELAVLLPFDEAEALLDAAIRKTPEKVSLYRTRGALRRKAGRHLLSLEDFEKAGGLTPNDGELFAGPIAGSAVDIVKEASLTLEQKRDVIRRGLQALDRAEVLKASEIQVMWYRSQLLGEKAKLESDPAIQKKLSEEAEKLGERALAMLEAQRVAARKERLERTKSAAAESRPLPPAPDSGPYRFTGDGDVKAPVVLTRVEPVIPDLARKARVGGIVVVEALIDKSGRVADVQVLESLPFGLDQAALDAVKQWTFRPGTRNGKPVDVLFNLLVNIKVPPANSP